MQRAEEYGGGIHSAPLIPPDRSGLYGGTLSYPSAPPSAPSAPAYAQAAPSYHQPTYLNSSSVPAHNPHLSSSFSPQDPAPSYPSSYAGRNSPPHFADDSSSLLAFSNTGYAPASYAPVVPTYPLVGSAYDRSFAPPPSTSVDWEGSQLRSLNSTLGLAPQQSSEYDSYGRGKVGSQGEHRGYQGAMYEQGAGYGKSDYGLSELGSFGVHRDAADRSHESDSFSGVYAYDGGGVDTFRAPGAGIDSWGGTGGTGDTSGSKTRRATPKVDGDAELGGVQKFRVKMLPDTKSSDSVKDVVCQIGLDGVRMVDPITNRTLRIYPLDTITKWEVKEPSIFTFWAKSAVDVDQRIIQLKSSRPTTTAILDTLTAACVQLSEMVGKDGPSDGSNSSGGEGTGIQTSATKKGSVLDWVALRPRAVAVEEKQHWVPDEAVTKCTSCDSDFGAFLRRHHCRNCGDIFCDRCTKGRINLNTDEDSQLVRVCDRCLGEVTHRLENMAKASSKVSVQQRTHEDLAKKLQEELERSHISRKPGSTTLSSGSGSSQQTSVLNCKKCGSISLVLSNSSRCPTCGADSGNVSSWTEKTKGLNSTSAAPRGPPHLWSSDTPGTDGPGPLMREVACPTCTVHLQVQVPSFGTETVECGVCQHPFLVNA